MNKIFTGKIFYIIFLLAISHIFVLQSYSQYFGKNKVVYNVLDWYYTETDNFIIHWYSGMEIYIPYLKQVCEESYDYLREVYRHDIDEKVPIIFYKNSDDFQQTGIVSGFLPEGVRGFAEPFSYRVVIPLDSPIEEIRKVIVHEINHIFQFSMYYRSFAMVVSRMPLWFDEGLSVHFADQWDSSRKMYLRDALYKNTIPPIKDLGTGFFDAYVFGPSIISFIEHDYGLDGLRALIFEASKHKNKDFPRHLKDSLGIDIDELDRRWKAYIKEQELKYLINRKDPHDYSRRYGERRRGVSSFSPEPSPSGYLVAYLSNASMFLGIRIMNLETDKDIFNITRGKDFSDYLWLSSEGSAISWSPDGEKVAFSAKWEGRYRLYLIDVLTHKITKRFDLDVHNVKTPHFMPDSERILFSANSGGLTNIYILNIKTGELENLTDSKYFDQDPSVSCDGKYLFFSSFRESYFRLVKMCIETRLEEVLISWEGDIIQPSYIKGENSLVFSSNKQDYIYDLYIYHISENIAHRITNFTTGGYTPKIIYGLDNKPEKIIYSGFQNRRYNIYSFNYKEINYYSTIHLGPSKDHKFTAELGIDGFSEEEDKNLLKLKFYVDAIDAAVAYRSDGIFVAQTVLAFADIMGDNNIVGIYQQFGRYANFMLYYHNSKQRFNYGASVYYNNYLNYLPGTDGRVYTIDKFWGLSGLVSYPLSLFSRFEFSAGYENAHQPIYQFLQTRDPDSQLIYGRLSYVSDKSLFNVFGPYKGHRARLSLQYAPSIGNSFDSNITATLDSRFYLPFSQRNLIAVRISGGYSSGDLPRYFYLGGADTFLGNNTLRGYKISEFAGTRFALVNIEWRLPLIDLIAFSFGLGFPYIQGTIFWDMGVAWDRTSDLDLFDRSDGSLRFKDIKSSIGYVISLPVQGVLLNWTFVRKFDLRSTISDMIYQFSIGTRF